MAKLDLSLAENQKYDVGLRNYLAGRILVDYTKQQIRDGNQSVIDEFFSGAQAAIFRGAIETAVPGKFDNVEKDEITMAAMEAQIRKHRADLGN